MIGNFLFKFLAAEGGGHQGAPELANFITVLHHYFIGTSFADFIHKWENVIFSLIIVVVLSTIVRLAQRNPKLVPGKLQCVIEMVVEGAKFVMLKTKEGIIWVAEKLILAASLWLAF